MKCSYWRTSLQMLHLNLWFMHLTLWFIKMRTWSLKRKTLQILVDDLKTALVILHVLNISIKCFFFNFLVKFYTGIPRRDCIWWLSANKVYFEIFNTIINKKMGRKIQQAQLIETTMEQAIKFAVLSLLN